MATEWPRREDKPRQDIEKGGEGKGCIGRERKTRQEKRTREGN